MTARTDSQTRKQTLERIKEMVTEGKTLKEAIAANGTTIGNYYRWKAVGRKGGRQKAAKAPQTAGLKSNTLFNGDFFQFVLTNPKFSDAQRVKVLKAYVQA